MLAGMRVAFESMLAEFDPDRLQQEFDRQLSKGLVPAKLRYWDLLSGTASGDRRTTRKPPSADCSARSSPAPTRNSSSN